jgi:uncharacterized protein YcfJ
VNRHFATSILMFASFAAACAQSQGTAPTQSVPNQSIQNQSIQNAGPQNPATQSAVAQSKSSSAQPIYLPSGLDIQIRVNESLSSATAQAGDTFTGTLVNSIEDDNNNIIFERGTPVSGRVISAKPSGRLQDSGQLVLSLNTIRNERQVANLTVISKEINGVSHTGSNTAKVGGGAVLGAILGGLAGGGKGAAIGAGAGAAAGTGAAAATGRKEAKVDPETIVRFVTSTETTVVAADSPAAQEMERQPNIYHGTNGPADANAPILRRRSGDPVPDNEPTSNTRQSPTVADNTSSSDDAPVMRRRSDNGSDPSSAAQSSSNTSAVPGASTNSSDAATTNVPNSNIPTGVQLSFSARDRRVINNCLADNPGSVPAPTANAIPYHKGDTLPYAAQKQIRSLPLACERQLAPLSSDMERVIYNQQVLLIDSNSLVLDSLDVNHQ